MYVHKIANRNSPPTYLLREGRREGGKVLNRTLGNLSHLPKPLIDVIRRYLKGDTFVSVDDDFDKVNSWHHGHVDAVFRTMKRLDFAKLIFSRRCRERDLVLAMVAGRILEPNTEQNSKLANTRWWKITTLPSLLDVEGADEDELYEAMDWLLERQEAIEKKLAKQHLEADGLVLYDLTSSYFEGATCPLAALGHNRDGKKGKLQVNYGLIADERGRPVAVDVFPGNTTDSKTVMAQVHKLRSRFGIQSMVFVGDRGMITQKLIDEELGNLEWADWITALKTGAIRKLVANEHLQLGLFDERNLFETTSPDYPGERFIACRNQELAKLRAHKRQALLEATAETLQRTRAVIEGGKLRGKDKITRRLENLVKQYKVAKETTFKVRDDGFDVHFADRQQAAQAAFAGAQTELRNIHSSLGRGKLKGNKRIRERVNKVIRKYNLVKHVVVDVHEGLDVRIEDPEAAAATAQACVEQKLEEIRALVERGRYGGKDAIGVRVGKVVDKYKVAKHFVLDIHDDGFDFHIDHEKVAAEAALDGVYVVRTSLAAERLSAEDTVRSYKSLAVVERIFRSMKTVDIKVRPIRHRISPRVRAHIFLCMLACYVEWHMREAWRPLIFADEDQEAKKTRDPVAPAKRSESAMKKVHSKRLDDGTEVHSFQTLLKSLSQIVRNECLVPSAESDDITFEIVTTPNEQQQRAYELLETIEV